MFSLFWWSKLLLLTVTLSVVLVGSRNAVTSHRTFHNRESFWNIGNGNQEPRNISFCMGSGTQSCFITSQKKKNWTEAHSFCRSQGGFLPGKEELKFLTSLQYLHITPNLTWSALGRFSGTYQWLNQKPSVARFIEWEKNHLPLPWDPRCPLFNSVTAKYLLAECSQEYSIVCIISEHKIKGCCSETHNDIELRVTSNLPDKDGWIEVNRSRFHELVLSCSIHDRESGREITNNTNVHWSKDGIWMSNYQPTIHPATTYDPYKSSWLRRGVTIEALEPVKQGSFCCEAWIPFSTVLKRSNCFFITLTEWTTMIATLRLQSRLMTNSVENVIISLFEKSSPDISPLHLAPIRVLKLSQDPQFTQLKQLSDYEYKFHVYSKNFSHENGEVMKNKLDRFTAQLRHLQGFSNRHFSVVQSNVRFAIYCNAFSAKEKYGNYIDYPFLKAGEYSNSKYKCETINNKLIYSKCHWNYTEGAKIFRDFNCSRMDLCPRGFSVINGTVCLKLVLNVSWEEGFNNFYKIGNEFTLLEKSSDNDSVHSHAVEYLLDSEIQTIWLILKRRYKHTELTNFSRLSQSSLLSFIQPKSNTNYKWRKGHPKADKKCVALDLHFKEYYSLDCDEKNNFVILIDTNDLSVSSRFYNTTINAKDVQNFEDSYERHNKTSHGICKAGWIELPTLKGTKLCTKQFFLQKALTWEEANTFCSFKNANLPSLQKGFLNWSYSRFFKSSAYWINIKIQNNLDSLEFEYLNWLPSSNFSNIYGAMGSNGWFLANESATKNNIICEMKPIKINFPEILLRRSSNYHSDVLCINKYIIISHGAIQCFRNGMHLRDIKLGRNDCPIFMKLSTQGYYECEMWSDETNERIESNGYLYRNENFNAYVVIGSDFGKVYDPLIHDSTFIKSHQQSETLETVCIEKIKHIFRKQKNINISDVLFFEKDDVFYYSFVLFCRRKYESFCSSEKFVQMKLSEILSNNSSSTQNCSLEEVKSTTGCLQEITKDEFNNNRSITWPNTVGIGRIVPNELCVDEDGQPVIRSCQGNFFNGFSWKEAPEGCPGVPSNRTINIWKSTQDPSGYLQGKYAKLSTLTEKSESLLPVDLYYVASAFQIISEDTKYSQLVHLEDIVETMNNIMSVSPKTMTSVSKHFNSSAAILTSFEKLAFKSESNENISHSKKSIFKEKIGTEYVDLSENVSVIGYEAKDLKGSLLTEKDWLYDDTEIAIILPKNLTKNIMNLNKTKSLEKVSILFVVYYTDILFYDSRPQSLDFRVYSKIIQATYENMTVENMEEKIQIIFRRKFKTNELVCVFWDFKKNKRKGGWSQKGCNLKHTDKKWITCECNHLTAFSLLIRYNNVDEYIEPHRKILQLISILGCGLSMIGLSLVLLTFLMFRKWRRSLSHQILANLSLAILTSLFIFIGGINQTMNALICRIVAISLHYFILVSFGWMLVEGVHQYLKFVKVVGTYVPRFIRKAVVGAWGIPTLPIMISLIIDPDLYSDGTISDICWVKEELFIYGFVPLISLVLFVNIILFSMIIDNVMVKKKIKNSSLQNRQTIMTQVSMAICVSSLLGFTWIFGLLAVSDGTVVFSYLFCIFNTLQGFGIFLFHLCRDRSARHFWNNPVGGIFQSSSINRSMVTYTVTENANSFRKSWKGSMGRGSVGPMRVN